MMNQNQQLQLAGKVADQFFSRVSAKVPYRTRRRLDKDDCRQEAYAAVLGCYADANMSKPNYLRRVVWNNLISWLKRECKISDAETQFCCDPLPEAALDWIEDKRPFTNPSDRAAMNEVNRAVDALPVEQSSAIRGFMRDETRREMARVAGVSHQAISGRFLAGLNILRVAMGVV